MTSPCTPAPLAYTDLQGFETLSSGHRTRQTCGIFVCAPRPRSVYGVEGTEIPEYRPPFLSGFEPPRRPYRVALPTSKISRSASHGQ